MCQRVLFFIVLFYVYPFYVQYNQNLTQNPGLCHNNVCTVGLWLSFFDKIYEFCFIVQLAKGYPLPALKNMNLLNTQLQILKVRDCTLPAWFICHGIWTRAENFLKVQVINRDHTLKAVNDWCFCGVFFFCSRTISWLGQMSTSQVKRHFCTAHASTITAREQLLLRAWETSISSSLLEFSFLFMLFFSIF